MSRITSFEPTNYIQQQQHQQQYVPVKFEFTTTTTSTEQEVANRQIQENIRQALAYVEHVHADQEWQDHVYSDLVSQRQHQAYIASTYGLLDITV